MSYDRTEEEYNRDTSASKASYWAGKEQAIALEIECWEFQKVEAEQNAIAAKIDVELHQMRLDRQKEQVKALKIIEGM